MEKRKKISIALTGFLPTDQRMQRIAQAICDLGFETVVYSRVHFKYQKTNIETAIFPFQSILIHTKISSGVLFYLSFNIKLFFKLLFKKCDYLYAVDSDTLPAMLLLSKLKQVKLIYDAHEYFAEVPELENRHFKKKIWHWVTQIGVKQASKCLTVGESLAKALQIKYGKPFLCVRNVPFEKTTHSTEKFDRPSIIYQGALNKGRQLELLIESMKELDTIDCLLIGEGDLSETLRNRAHAMENVKFLGLMSPMDIQNITPKCSIGFNLLEGSNSLSYHFSLSNKYFDYMQAGIPSLSSELPEYQSLNAQYKCGLCIPNTKSALIETVNSLFTDSKMYQKLSENAIIAARENNWQIEKDKLKTLFQH